MQENTIFKVQFNSEQMPKIDRKEVWRYAGYFGKTDEITDELKSVLDEVLADTKDMFSYKICFRRLPKNDESLKFLEASKGIKKLLCSSHEVIIFCATVGTEIDRYIKKEGAISPLKMTLANALGAERIEALCDKFQSEIEKKIESENLFVTKRFSPGYGDLPLETQKDFIALLDTLRQVGVSLGASLLMSPSKSVTAIFGISDTESKKTDKCKACSKLDCEFRKAN